MTRHFIESEEELWTDAEHPNKLKTQEIEVNLLAITLENYRRWNHRWWVQRCLRLFSPLSTLFKFSQATQFPMMEPDMTHVTSGLTDGIDVLIQRSL